MDNNHIAHMRISGGKTIIQSVKEHSIGVALYASQSLNEVGLANTGYLVGLLHDMGKSTEAFDAYIRASVNGENPRKGSVPHTFTGVKYILSKFHEGSVEWQWKLTSEIIAYVIGSHHGLFDCVSPADINGFSYRMDKDNDEIHYDEAVTNFFAEVVSEEEVVELFEKACKEVETFYHNIVEEHRDKNRAFFQIGMLTRLVLSAIIDGDRRDTAEFSFGEKFNPKEMSSRNWGIQLDYLEKQMSGFNKDSDINRVRTIISEQCKAFAQKDKAIYRMTVPTGGGKTLASLRYALCHAKQYNKKRIIFIIPLLSVLDQNSKVIRENIENEELILEHHSNIISEKSDGNELDERELLIDTWDSPIIISTLVQLLNVFFSHKTSAVRRLKSLCDSVVVIDEVQSLPPKFTILFNQVINFLEKNCNTTVVLSSATQPCFDKAYVPMHVAKEADIVKYDQELFKVFDRTNLIDKTTPSGITLEELGDFAVDTVNEKDSVLIVCNTKAEARSLYRQITDRVDDKTKVYHLSTSMCKAHREDVLKRIGKTPGLNGAEKVVCVSTQIVEAGIDFSFQCVIRIKAGMDNIVQALGRCNRNNEWGKICDAYVVNIKNEKLGSLEEIKISQRCFEELSNEYHRAPENFDGDLISNKTIKTYYEILFNKEDNKRAFENPITVDGMKFSTVDMLSCFKAMSKTTKHQAYCLNQAFKTAGENCKVFDDNTIDVIVPYNKEAGEIIANIYSERAENDMLYMKEQINSAKPYTVSLYEGEFKKIKEMVGIKEDNNRTIFTLNKLTYDEKALGVCLDGQVTTGDFMSR